ncbi:MAG: radical SAM protein, partial [Candidatus Thorarchaeota archaeon]
VWERIHLPVAPRCNVKCVFCDRRGGTSCHMPVPGRAWRTMEVPEALRRLEEELRKRPRLRIVAVSGPGEPLYNDATLALMHAVRRRHSDLEFCLSTNGLLLESFVKELSTLGLHAITVSVHSVEPEIVEKAYEWVKIDGIRIKTGFGEEVISRQIRGICEAAASGIHVKVNTVLMPDINAGHIESVARVVSEAGAKIQNIMPLVPCGSLCGGRAPTPDELARARQAASAHIDQFLGCKLCRSDVVGIPGFDTVL